MKKQKQSNVTTSSKHFFFFLRAPAIISPTRHSQTVIEIVQDELEFKSVHITSYERCSASISPACIRLVNPVFFFISPSLRRAMRSRSKPPSIGLKSFVCSSGKKTRVPAGPWVRLTPTPCHFSLPSSFLFPPSCLPHQAPPPKQALECRCLFS